MMGWRPSYAGGPEGRSEGKLEGLRVALLTLLRRRFGIGSSEVADQLQTIDNPKKLEKLLERAIDARSLDELGLAS